MRDDTAGSVAMEFALIAIPLMLFVFVVCELGYDFYAQNALDYVLSTSVRMIATGSLQGTATSMATFQSVAVCSTVGTMLPCNSILLNVTPVSGFSATGLTLPETNGQFDPSGFRYCPGSPGQLMMAQAVYPAPTFVGGLLPGGIVTYGGSSVRLIASTAGFVNEPYTATAPPPAGC